MAFDNLKAHLLNAAVTAALLGGGTALISTRVNDARQDEKINKVEEAMRAIPDIQKDLRVTREGIIRVEAKLESNP